MLTIDPQVQVRMVEHLKNGTTDLAAADLYVPISNFSSSEIAQRERDMMRARPLIVAHRSELPEPGSFITRDVLGTAIIIARQTDGSVAAFRNMCRHRGGKVETAASGKKRFFVCGYHGWSYDRNGTLKGVPFESSFDPIDRSCRSLIPVQCDERHGFVWVNLSSQQERDVASFLGQADAVLGSLQINDRVIVLDKTFTLPVNWKLVVDGATDILHPQFLHPNGVGKLIHGNTSVWQGFGRHCMSFSPRKRLVETVEKGLELPSEGLYRYFGGNFFVYPNSLVFPTPDHIEFWTVWPSTISPGESMTHIRFLIRPEIINDQIMARVNKSWEILQDAAVNEDWPMEVSIQANANANPQGTFIYGRSEVSCQHLHRQLKEDLEGLSV
jgi:nitrite reductase/ring-hydroxylating ferredoxin subunit